MVMIAPGMIALINRVRMNNQDASSELDLRRTGFSWSVGVLMLQKETSDEQSTFAYTVAMLVCHGLVGSEGSTVSSGHDPVQ